MNYQETAERLASVCAPSGFESPVMECIEELARPFATDLHRDALGNLIVHHAGSGRRVMVAAHADTFGMIMTFRDEHGFWRFGLLGKADAGLLTGLPVVFSGGARGVIGCDSGVEKPEVRNLYLDVISGEVRIGDVCVPELGLVKTEERMASPALEGRAACAAALMVLELAQDSDADLYVVFTVQRTVGERGAGAAAFAVEPEQALLLELTTAGDVPEPANRSAVTLGGGPALPVRIDRHPANLELLEELESRASVPTQRTVDPDSRSDLGKIAASRSGVRACVVGIPARRSGLMTVICPADAVAAAKLVRSIL